MQTPVILIVEDEEVTRLNLVSLFQGEGYDVIEAVNGEEMNQKLTDNKVNLVVMDINLPGKNGRWYYYYPRWQQTKYPHRYVVKSRHKALENIMASPRSYWLRQY